ncbi:hypothetical protein N7492_006253 [Penicillium capsulatum]|uniref:Uncharacterized protein n=1 Tax=Penicillium capsulatum TaxID=69766 RepID=A0A9W9LLY7_9EURO|nr:hypothetical protein N7492_006253 [Penicillium capsulatum]
MIPTALKNSHFPPTTQAREYGTGKLNNAARYNTWEKNVKGRGSITWDHWFDFMGITENTSLKPGNNQNPADGGKTAREKSQYQKALQRAEIPGMTWLITTTLILVDKATKKDCPQTTRIFTNATGQAVGLYATSANSYAIDAWGLIKAREFWLKTLKMPEDVKVKTVAIILDEASKSYFRDFSVEEVADNEDSYTLTPGRKSFDRARDTPPVWVASIANYMRPGYFTGSRITSITVKQTPVEEEFGFNRDGDCQVSAPVPLSVWVDFS